MHTYRYAWFLHHLKLLLIYKLCTCGTILAMGASYNYHNARLNFHCISTPNQKTGAGK